MSPEEIKTALTALNSITDPAVIDSKKGLFYGLAIGDALGAAVEFMEPGEFEPVTSYRGKGPHQLEPGEWTDDMSMALALADSLSLGWDTRDQLQRYLDWFQTGKYSVNGTCFDIGTTTRNALMDFELKGQLISDHDDFSAGNGSIMRLAPIVIKYDRDIEELSQLAGQSSATTHSHRDCIAGCQFLARFCSFLLYNKTCPQFSLSLAMDYAPLTPRIWEIEKTYYITELIKGSGYVVQSLQAALWAFFTTTNFEDCVLRAVNLGNDADTTGAVAGQIAGAFYGFSKIPQHLIDGLARKDMIDLYLNKLLGE